MKKILILCTGNSCRSQIAEGYLRHYVGGRAEVYSAGIETHGVNPKAIEVMKADGIDISTHTSNHIDEYQSIDFDWVITVCDHARERCPYFPSGAQLLHHNFPDPASASAKATGDTRKVTGSAEEVMRSFVEVRELIKGYCKEFVNNNLR